MVKSARSLLVVVTVVVVLLCAKVAINIVNRPDDPKLVQHALAEAIQASREGRPGGVIDVLSDTLKVNDTSMSGDVSRIADFVRKQHPDIVVKRPEAQIIGDEARIVSPIDLDLGKAFGKREIPDVTLIFKKEDTTEYLVIPARKWRLTQVLAPESAISDLVSGESSP